MYRHVEDVGSQLYTVTVDGKPVHAIEADDEAGWATIYADIENSDELKVVHGDVIFTKVG